MVQFLFKEIVKKKKKHVIAEPDMFGVQILLLQFRAVRLFMPTDAP